jgi:hypothetical protein
MNKFENEFQKEMELHLVKFKVENQYLPSNSKKAWLYNDVADNLFPPIRHGFLQYIYDEALPLHDFIDHVRSSQAYCINTLYPVLTQKPKSLLALLGEKVHKDLTLMKGFQFEYSPETNVLGEWRSEANRPEEYVTAVDLRIDAQNNTGDRILFLIEVKFTESSFGSCGGFDSGGNTGETRRACENGKELLKDFNACYLHGSNGKGKLRRTYFGRFEPMKSHFDEASFGGKCPFINLHQCLRNHALARYHRSNGEESYFGLLHHEANESIVEEWQKYVSLLQTGSRAEVFSLTGKEVVENSGIETLKAYYRDRYTLSQGAQGT